LKWRIRQSKRETKGQDLHLPAGSTRKRQRARSTMHGAGANILKDFPAVGSDRSDTRVARQSCGRRTKLGMVKRTASQAMEPTRLSRPRPQGSAHASATSGVVRFV
jgi:hypothetical protein